MINEILIERNLPELLKMNNGETVTRDTFRARRREMLDMLAEWEYGRFPDKCGETTWSVTSEKGDIGGRAVTKYVDITFPTPDGESFTFPINVTIPKSASSVNQMPAIVFISFGESKYFPIEEIIEKDVIVAEMVLNNVTKDADDGYTSLMAPHYFKEGKRESDGTGKIGMWAFASSRVLDYLLTFECVDTSRLAVMGHSRLGKTALWAGANDERFTHVYSNDSGCSGAAITRGKVGEKFTDIFSRFPYWFCENFRKISETVEKSESTSFDQHFLLACCCPRKVYVASAELDEWADPVSEYLCCAAASPAWELIGKKGFIHPDEMPKAWDRFADGDIGYHLRPDGHFLSRHDWMRFIDFLKK